MEAIMSLLQESRRYDAFIEEFHLQGNNIILCDCVLSMCLTILIIERIKGYATIQQRGDYDHNY